VEPRPSPLVLDSAEAPARPPLSAAAQTALIHLYRAEVSRLTAYRQRLDTTTNWAITSSALVTTFSLGNAQIPHAAFLFLMIVDFFFLTVEARRFRVYEASRFRVLVLERYFYPDVLGRPSAADWQHQLIESLRTPYSYPSVGFLGAIGWRLRRNYLWIYVAVFLTWLAKLDIAGGPGTDLVREAHVGSVPGIVVWAVILVGYLVLGGIGLLAKRTYPMGTEAARAVLSAEPD
jgi:uncharacterized membrane protein